MLYDRTLLQQAARKRGADDYKALAADLALSPATAWRLWTGKNAPSAATADRVQTAYGLTVAQLRIPAQPAEQAAA
ncbi:XRE family transcriptional regulator [Streptomyces sp. NPDC057217]|uniref:XRE family transcriptional regulator n=1 Tax=Streptomyces sp. NPDC057217 TaxID=3346054 RepID=UPI00362F0B35